MNTWTQRFSRCDYHSFVENIVLFCKYLKIFLRLSLSVQHRKESNMNSYLGYDQSSAMNKSRPFELRN